MTRVKFFACVGLSSLAGLAAAPAFAQVVGQMVGEPSQAQRPYLRGRVLTWPGKTDTAQAPAAAPLPPPAQTYAPPPVPVEVQSAPARQALRAPAPPLRPVSEPIQAPPPAAIVADSRYGAARAVHASAPEPRTQIARSAPVPPPQAAPNPWAAASRAPLTPAEAAPGQWIVIRGPAPVAAAAPAKQARTDFKPPRLAKPVAVTERAFAKAPPPPAPIAAPAATPMAVATGAPKPAHHEAERVQTAAVRPAPTPAPVKSAAASAPAADQDFPDPSKLPPPVMPWTARFAQAPQAMPSATAAPVKTAAVTAKPEKVAAAKSARGKAGKQAVAVAATSDAVGPPRPLPPAGERVRFYSVHRDFGLTPSPAPIPPQFFGATADLSDPAGPEATPAQTTGKGAAAARARALADTSSSND